MMTSAAENRSHLDFFGIPVLAGTAGPALHFQAD
jgi:hypothetical protein